MTAEPVEAESFWAGPASFLELSMAQRLSLEMDFDAANMALMQTYVRQGFSYAMLVEAFNCRSSLALFEREEWGVAAVE